MQSSFCFGQRRIILKTVTAGARHQYLRYTRDLFELTA